MPDVATNPPSAVPVLPALEAIVIAARAGREEPDLDDVRAAAGKFELTFGCRQFDLAAASVGLVYSRSLDAYVAADFWAEVELNDGEHFQPDRELAEAAGLTI